MNGPELVASGAGTLLGSFNAAGVLAPIDLHVAVRLTDLAGDTDEEVALAVAMAVRAPRVGSVAADLAGLREAVRADTTAGDDVDIDALGWPEPAGWVAQVAASALVAVGDDPADRPLRLVGTELYLDRYWRDELAVAADLRARAGAAPEALDDEALAQGLRRLFPAAADADQRLAAATAARRRLTVVAGGPGTGKTTTVARLLAVLHEQAVATGRRRPLVALAAPTGKAAARLEAAVRREASTMPVEAATGMALGSLRGTTLHRLLGSRPGSARFRHHVGHRLPHDVVVVDEVSMVSLGLTARLCESVRPDARLVLVGDPQQLVSVEAGAVLADIVAAAAAGPLAGTVALLRTNHRASGALAALAGTVRDGDVGATLALLASGDPSLAWTDTDPVADPEALRAPVAGRAAEVVALGRAGEASAALVALGRHRLLCAHRSGPVGVSACNDLVAGWAGTGGAAGAGDRWYAGRPILVTTNDYATGVFNGDAGVAVAGPGGELTVALDAGGGTRSLHPGRFAGVETAFAMTVHKAQGSEFDEVTLVLPPPGSRLLTRELLYTAVTRARHRLVVIAPAASLAEALGRPATRASGLTARLAVQ